MERVDRSFEPIGPFDLRRSDQMVAVTDISFRLGSAGLKLFNLLRYGLFATLAVYFAFDGTWLLTAAFVFLIILSFFAPLLRSNRLNRAIVVSDSAEGIVVETLRARITYKWATLGPSIIWRRRLVVMITGRIGLVVPLRATTRANLEAVANLVRAKRPVSPSP